MVKPEGEARAGIALA